MDSISKFHEILTSRLTLISEGKYDATDEILKYSDTSQYDPEVAQLAETAGFLSVKLEAREMALEKSNADLRKALAERQQFGVFFILFTFWVALLTFVMAYFDQSSLSKREIDEMSPIICIGFLLFFIAMAVVQIRCSSFTLKDFGLTLRGSVKAIKESLLVTLVIMVLMTLIRWWCGEHLEAFKGKPFFDLSVFNVIFWAYFIVAPGQEFIARGTVQTILYRLLATKNARFWAIFLASLIFGATHTYYSFWLSIISAFAGFIWGWLYMRHGTIVGVAISHAIIGNYFEMLGFFSAIR